jgi:hypothetical protein
MSVREFAAHLGVSDRMVSKWEAGGESIHPRPLNQAALDTSLAMSTPEVKDRFRTMLGDSVEEAARPETLGCTVLAWPTNLRHVARHPLDGKLMTLVEGGPFHGVWLPSFFIDVRPTSNAEYGRFLTATGRQPPAQSRGGICPGATEVESLVDVVPDQREPAEQIDPLVDDPVNVTWDEACAYAEWSAKRLPTVEEWDRAAGGAAGMVVGVVGEWCVSAGAPVRRGAKDRDRASGFRCVLSTGDMLALLAI